MNMKIINSEYCLNVGKYVLEKFYTWIYSMQYALLQLVFREMFLTNSLLPKFRKQNSKFITRNSRLSQNFSQIIFS